jgi:hypothetical protein
VAPKSQKSMVYSHASVKYWWEKNPFFCHFSVNISLLGRLQQWQKWKKVMDATRGGRPTMKMPPQTHQMSKQGQGNFRLRSRENTATDYENAIDRATYDRIQGEKQDHLFWTLRRQKFLTAPVQKLPSGIQNLLAETF